MSRRNVRKVGLVAALIFVALVAPTTPRIVWREGELTLLLLVFGTANAVLDVPGTAGLRYLSLGMTLIGLLMPPVGGLIVAMGWLIWPAAFMMAWSTARHTSDTWDPEPADGAAAGRRARTTLAAIIAAVAVASLAFRLIVGGGLQQTAALFVGIPALLAIVVVLVSSPRTATGVAFKAVTVGLLVSLLFLGVGILCVVMSAPLFYLVAGGMAAVADRSRQRGTPTMTGMILLVTVPMSLEGVMPVTTFNRDESVSEARIVRATPEAIERALFEQPRFD